MRLLLACVTFGPPLFFPPRPEAQNAGNASRPDAAPPVATLLDQAKQLVQQGDPQSALSTLDQAPPHGPYAAAAHTLKGNSAWRCCRNRLNLRLNLTRQLPCGLTTLPRTCRRASAYAMFNNLDRALERLAVAVKLAPNLPGVRYNYALVLARAVSIPSLKSR